MYLSAFFIPSTKLRCFFVVGSFYLRESLFFLVLHLVVDDLFRSTDVSVDIFEASLVALVIGGTRGVDESFGTEYERRDRIGISFLRVEAGGGISLRSVAISSSLALSWATHIFNAQAILLHVKKQYLPDITLLSSFSSVDCLVFLSPNFLIESFLEQRKTNVLSVILIRMPLFCSP